MITREQVERLQVAIDGVQEVLNRLAREPERPEAEWPSVPGLYWVRGLAGGEPVEGVAVLREAESQVLFLVDRGNIFRAQRADRLEECVPVTVAPRGLLAAFLAADRDDVWDAQEAMIAWVNAHPEAGGSRD